MKGGYNTYRFIDKDPIIDILRTKLRDDGLLIKDVAYLSGVTAGTISRWLYGDTKRPQHATVVAVARAMGYDYVLQEKGSSPQLKPIPVKGRIKLNVVKK